MAEPRVCPSCGGTHVQVDISHRRAYGTYRRLVCVGCEHRWTERDATKGPAPPQRHVCPECGTNQTAVIESRVEAYGRRQRIECRGCRHRWTNTIQGDLKARPQRRREAGDLREQEIELILLSTRSVREMARELGVSPKTVQGVRLGELHREVLPDLPRLGAKRRRSCTSCRFWDADPEAVRPCRLGWPDPATDGPGYANECEDYAPKRDGLLRTPATAGSARG